MKASDIGYILSLLDKDCASDTPLKVELRQIYNQAQSKLIHEWEVPVQPSYDSPTAILRVTKS
jgi:hypothetical protein